MSKSYEEISKNNANSDGKTDANLANDSNHLGGIAASEYITNTYLQQYYQNKETIIRQYFEAQDESVLNEAKEYTNSMIRNQDFSSFAKLTDVQALDEKLSSRITECSNTCADNLNTRISEVVSDVNANFDDVNSAINTLNGNQTELFQSVSDGKAKVAEAITDKGVSTSATATFDTMASNIRKIDTKDYSGSIIAIPDGYIDTRDASATAAQILQGYTAYANGEKLHGTLVIGDGSSSSTGGVILGEDEVVATKVYGEAGVLTGGKLEPNGITLNPNAISHKIALVCTKTYGDYIIASREMTEGMSNEIVIYNVSTTNQLYHKDTASKFSYTFEELGIEGELKCIAASLLEYQTGIVQISIGTSAGIYTYLFEAKGNNENGLIGKTIKSKNKIIINDVPNDYNSIAYSNTSALVFAYYSSAHVHIVETAWYIEQDIIEWTNVNATPGYSNNVMGLFRFSPSDRFLMFAPWGSTEEPEVCIMLLNDFVYITHQKITNSKTKDGWSNGQIAINSQDNFMILFGKPYHLAWNVDNSSIEYTKLSDSSVIPYNEGLNESLYATFSKDDKYVYAVVFDQGTVNGMYPLCCFKVDYNSLSNQWANVSNLLGVSANSNGSTQPVIDIVNKKVAVFNPNADSYGGFYHYYSDANTKELIGLSYNGNLYNRAWGV